MPKCPPHVVNEPMVSNVYRVKLKKGTSETEVHHVEKLCRECKKRVIILADRLLKIINDEGWEVDIEVLGS